MPIEVTALSAFFLGLLGSTHCVGMCGGIVGALTLGTRTGDRAQGPRLPYLLAYNTGRIASYAVAGALAGFLSAQLFDLGPTNTMRRLGLLVSAGFTFALGCYLTDLWRGLGMLERLGSRLWKHIEPLGRALLPVNHPGKALLIGAVWGWLPCGMVYAMLAWSLGAGSIKGGALVMASFGLGTLPMLFTMGTAARWLGERGRLPAVRRTIGWALLLFAIYLFAVGAGYGAAAEHIH